MPRSFIAIDVPKRVQYSISSFSAGSDVIRPVKPGMMHITLAFLGDARDEELPNIKRILRSISERTFNISISGISTFTDRSPRVFYMQIRDGYDKLSNLHNYILEAMRDSGIRKVRGTDNFIPHLTIGRLRSYDDESVSRALEFVSRLNLEDRSFSFVCESISLLRSETGKGGHIYKRMLKVELSKSY